MEVHFTSYRNAQQGSILRTVLFSNGPFCFFLPKSMRLTNFHFLNFVTYFSPEKGDDDDDGDNVYSEDQPIQCVPRREHRLTSNRGADIDVHIAPRAANAPQAGPLSDKEVIQSGGQLFRQGNFAKDQTHHAGSTGS